MKIKLFENFLNEGYNRINYEFGKSNDGKEIDVYMMIGCAVVSKLGIGQLFDMHYCMESLHTEMKKKVGDLKDRNPLDIINEIIKDNKYMADLYDTIVTSAAEDKVMSMEEVIKIKPKK